MLNTLYMYCDDKDTNTTLNTEHGKKPVLVHLSIHCIKQLDTIAGFYGKTRLAIIREIIQKGLKDHSDTYSAQMQGLNEMNRVFNEMSLKTAEREQKLRASKARWEDSY